jgi:uroporphyrinogen-III decarboxylase
MTASPLQNGNVSAVLDRQRPERIPYAPNYWQWFEHRKNHGLPDEIAHCRSQLDLLGHLEVDVFSRNIYSDQQTGWLGGLCDVVWENVDYRETETGAGRDRVFERVYRTRKGTLSERLRYVHSQSTLVQEKFLVDDRENQIEAFLELVRARRWRFVPERYAAVQKQIRGDGAVIAGEVYSPLKLLHWTMNPVETSYFLADDPGLAAEILVQYEAAALDLVRQMASAGVRAIMSMDNLDTMFHPPRVVEKWSAHFYEEASRICHGENAVFFIHACGKQKGNLGLIASLGVDGLEGVAFPNLGDVELDEAMRLSGDRLIVTGGISAMEFERMNTREAVFAYVADLFRRMEPFRHRFILSSSCTTPYTAPWEMLKHFRDAWLEFGTGRTR